MGKFIKITVIAIVCAVFAYVIHSIMVTSKIDENTVD